MLVLRRFDPLAEDFSGIIFCLVSANYREIKKISTLAGLDAFTVQEYIRFNSASTHMSEPRILTVQNKLLSEDVHRFHLKFPPDIWEQLRLLAFERRRPVRALVLDWVTTGLAADRTKASKPQ